MHAEQLAWTVNDGWQRARAHSPLVAANLVLAFGARACLDDGCRFDELRVMHPDAHIVLVSTAGEIFGDEVRDDTVSAVAMRFDSAHVSAVSTVVDGPDESYAAGLRLALELPPFGLRHVLVFAEGLRINGDELVRGLRAGVRHGVVVTGGLAGDGARMERTLVGLDAPPTVGRVAAIGLHGDCLTIGYGSLGGWDAFGPERLITRARGNVLYELDGEPALDLYKTYLGEHASGLPSTGLLFPLALRAPNADAALVRTVLAVDEEMHSMTFAGDLPEGSFARLMKANFERLVDGALGAAQGSKISLRGTHAHVALLISCVGRKLVLKQRIEEEVEAVREVLGADTILTGFYSYGEICPQTASAKCELHNQTMTITTISEL